MSDENDQVEEAPLTQNHPPGVLAISREALTFTTPQATVHLTLDEILKGAAGNQGPVGLLLYAIVLKLRDVDASLRSLVGIAQGQVTKIEGMGYADPTKMIGQVVDHLKELGLAPPGQAIPEPQQKTGGNGAS